MIFLNRTWQALTRAFGDVINVFRPGSGVEITAKNHDPIFGLFWEG